jgi:exopolysaccharide biosynthesis polyprenyl glycosylphosphotransferase
MWPVAVGGSLVALTVMLAFSINLPIWSASAIAAAPLLMLTLSTRRREAVAEGVLILGVSPIAAKLIEELEELEARGDRQFRLIGAVDDSTNGTRAPGVTPLLGRLDQFSQIIAVTRPRRIVIAMSDRRGRIPEGALLESRFRGVMVEDAVDFFERITGKLAIESLRPSSLILSDGFRHADFRRSHLWEAVRRIGSVAVASVALALLAPVLALIALAIKLDSAGPVFFVHERVGRGGRPFGLIKFRTMSFQQGKSTSEWVNDNADRITRVGKWLRRFRIDEIPQLINVVRGEMDFVGPRPHPASNYQLFLENIPYYGYRAMVRPGITGWAQVRYGYANDLQQETEKMRYDFYYIKHRCLRLDVRIAFETLGVLFFDRRSYQEVRRRMPTAAWSDVNALS